MQVTTQSSHFLHWAHPAHQGHMLLSVCIAHNTSGNNKENSPETLESGLPSQAVADIVLAYNSKKGFQTFKKE